MKKFLLVLGMVACLFGMTACGNEAAATTAADANVMPADDAAYFVDVLIADMNDLINDGLQEQYVSDAGFYDGLVAWETALTEMGSYVGVASAEGSYDGSNLNITAQIDGEAKDAELAVSLDTANGLINSISVTVSKTFGELMTNAALNTLLGMGTVFVVLILIAWLISLFKYIPAFLDKLSGKKTEKAPKAAAPAPAPVVAAPVVEEAAEEDDLELIAVIAAAIAASEGAASTDGFVVRSIKRRGSKWQKA